MDRGRFLTMCGHTLRGRFARSLVSLTLAFCRTAAGLWRAAPTWSGSRPPETGSSEWCVFASDSTHVATQHTTTLQDMLQTCCNTVHHRGGSRPSGKDRALFATPGRTTPACLRDSMTSLVFLQATTAAPISSLKELHRANGCAYLHDEVRTLGTVSFHAAGPSARPRPRLTKPLMHAPSWLRLALFKYGLAWLSLPAGCGPCRLGGLAHALTGCVGRGHSSYGTVLLMQKRNLCMRLGGEGAFWATPAWDSKLSLPSRIALLDKLEWYSPPSHLSRATQATSDYMLQHSTAACNIDTMLQHRTTTGLVLAEPSAVCGAARLRHSRNAHTAPVLS